jgi:hypothetical protein
MTAEPLSVSIPVRFVRLPRAKCGQCNARRVLFALTVYGEVRRVALCAICAQLR